MTEGAGNSKRPGGVKCPKNICQVHIEKRIEMGRLKEEENPDRTLRYLCLRPKDFRALRPKRLHRRRSHRMSYAYSKGSRCAQRHDYLSRPTIIFRVECQCQLQCRKYGKVEITCYESLGNVCADKRDGAELIEHFDKDAV